MDYPILELLFLLRSGDAGAGDVGHKSYTDICLLLRSGGGWRRSNPTGAAPAAFGEGLWVGYDTVRSVREKAEFCVARGLGGAMVWQLAQDDYRVRVPREQDGVVKH